MDDGVSEGVAAAAFLWLGCEDPKEPTPEAP